MGNFVTKYVPLFHGVKRRGHRETGFAANLGFAKKHQHRPHPFPAVFARQTIAVVLVLLPITVPKQLQLFLVFVGQVRKALYFFSTPKNVSS